MGWQPIETAPKDGTWIIVACKWGREEGTPVAEDWLRIVRYDPRKHYPDFAWATMDAEGIAFGGDIAAHIPTHWQPLPPPPQEDAE